MASFEPAYVKLLHNGELSRKAELSREILHCCKLCGWQCNKDRLGGKLGVCRTSDVARVSSYGPHMGEEDPLRGWSGSGTIFFTRCNMHCQFCQNHEISHTDTGELIDAHELAQMMLNLQNLGCHNINLVSPTHVQPQILAAVLLAAQAGLRLPLVYNTGGYDTLEALQILDGVVDIYMPDMKYASAQIARFYSKIPNYPEVNQAAVREMHRQVGDLIINKQGLAQRGLLIRHLVMPNNLSGTAEISRFIAREISKDTYVNLMDQYHPAYRARQFPRINRSVSHLEYEAAVMAARSAGLSRVLIHNHLEIN